MLRASAFRRCTPPAAAAGTTKFPSRPQRLPKFDAEDTFTDASTYELLRALAVFRICTFSSLVNRSSDILRKLAAVVGDRLAYDTFVKWTFFDHFCAGTNQENIRPVLKRLEAKNIGPIMDYAAEADIVDDAPPDQSNVTTLEVAMTKLAWNNEVKYDLSNTKTLDRNLELFKECIDAAAANMPSSGIAYAAIKISGLCDPQLLARVTAMVLTSRQSWLRMVEDEVRPLEQCRSVVRTLSKEQRYLSHEKFAKGMRKQGLDVTDEQLKELFAVLDPENTGSIEYLNYTSTIARAALDTTERTPPPISYVLDALPRLNPDERKFLDIVRHRLDSLAAYAQKKGVRLMIDAEQSWFQMAIDTFVRELQRKYNTKEPVIYNTYQCYLTSTPSRVRNDLDRARISGYCFGGKMVRGAYIVKENQKGETEQYESPIHDSKEATDDCYNKCAEMVMTEMVESEKKVGVLFGTHNEFSLKAITKITLKIEQKADGWKVKCPDGYEIAFAQLYGMGDHLTIPLARAGFSVFKYVPYGPTKETVHYLQRRAVENKGMIKNAAGEAALMRRELRRRVTGGPLIVVPLSAVAVLLYFLWYMFCPTSPRMR